MPFRAWRSPIPLGQGEIEAQKQSVKQTGPRVSRKQIRGWGVGTRRGLTSVTPSASSRCSAFSFSPIRTRSAASAASCLPCFLLCAVTDGNQRPPTFAWKTNLPERIGWRCLESWHPPPRKVKIVLNLQRFI